MKYIFFFIEILLSTSALESFYGFITQTRQTINKSQTFIRGPNQILHPFGIHVVFPGRLRTFKMKADILFQTLILKKIKFMKMAIYVLNVESVIVICSESEIL